MPRKKLAKKDVKTLINLKVTRKELGELKRRARQSQKGKLNLSAWLRRAGLSYRPSHHAR